MKNLRTLKYFLLLLVLALPSCDDFVEVEPAGKTDGNFFNTEEEYKDALVGSYDLLQATFWNVLTSVVASDDYSSGGDPFTIDQPTLQNVNYLTHTPADQNQIRDIWTLMYAGMNRVNYLLENQDKLDFTGKEEIMAEGYFLRAYYAFELAKFFGNVPLKTEERNGVARIKNERIFPGDQFSMERVSSVSAMYSLIQEDLKEAIPNLPVTQDLPYEATKGAAQALLGKVYLYDKKYSEAATVLNQVINSAQYSLVTGDDFINLFTSSGENGPESVFEIQYTNYEGAGWDCLACSEGSYFVQFNGPRSPYNDSVFASGWGFCQPTQQLYDSFENGDSRISTTFLDLRDLKAEDDASKYSPPREDTGFYNLKYAPRKSDKAGNASTAELVHKNNYRSIRYADVLLMAAEAEVKSSGSNAITYLNMVRARAYGDNSHDYTSSEGSLEEAIFEERRKELAGEGHRFFDLVRTDNAKEAFDDYNATIPADFESINFVEGKHELFPIPLIELELAQAKERWGQNPGYNN